MILLTQASGIMGIIPKFLGWIFNSLFEMTANFGIYNIGLTIILFTIVVKLLMLPLAIKQAKFSKFSSIMNPELQAIQKKYQGKNDQQSMMKMQEESRKVQEKYGVSPIGGCLQMVIQIPILLSLFRVIQNIPAYVGQIKELFLNMLEGPNGLMAQDNYINIMTENFGTTFGDYTTANASIDAMNNFSLAQWEQLETLFPQCSSVISTNVEQIFEMYDFFGINLAVPPVLASIAILIPILNYVFQWLSMKISNVNANNNNNDSDNQAAQTMKTMTIMMPFMSAFISISCPSGLGLYWICTAIVAIIQQLALNAYFNSIDMEELVRKNIEKANEKRKKQGLPPNTISSKANMNTKQISKAEKIQNMQNKLEETRKKNLEMVEEIKNSANTSGAPKKSIREKANMVSQYNEKNKK